MSEPVSIFEVLGPIMIGPSSSHTAGASRIGAITRQLLGEKPVRAVITLYNSFAKTHRGHGTDRALVGGILGFAPDDVRIKESFELAKGEGLMWEFKFLGDAFRFHSNTARVHLTGASGGAVELVGASLGGGRIRVQEIEGFEVDFSALTYTIVIERGVNIARMAVTRSEKMANMVIETDQLADPETMEAIQALPWVRFARVVEPLLDGSSRYEK
jgi:L-serine dehydratase